VSGYNFAYLDEQTKRMIRRAILKAVAIPGHQVPFGSREMPLPYGWGTGGIQVTASILGPPDVLKVIDQGADDTTNAVSIRRFFARTLVTHPCLLFMDEPTGGLDVSVQARLLDLIRTLVTRLGIAVVLVTHDIAVARLLAGRIVVMQGGRVVEAGLTDQVLDDPQHPYTQLLVSSVLSA